MIPYVCSAFQAGWHAYFMLLGGEVGVEGSQRDGLMVKGIYQGPEYDSQHLCQWLTAICNFSSRGFVALLWTQHTPAHKCTYSHTDIHITIN